MAANGLRETRKLQIKTCQSPELGLMYHCTRWKRVVALACFQTIFGGGRVDLGGFLFKTGPGWLQNRSENWRRAARIWGHISSEYGCQRSTRNPEIAYKHASVQRLYHDMFGGVFRDVQNYVGVVLAVFFCFRFSYTTQKGYSQDFTKVSRVWVGKPLNKC